MHGFLHLTSLILAVDLLLVVLPEVPEHLHDGESEEERGDAGGVGRYIYERNDQLTRIQDFLARPSGFVVVYSAQKCI